MLNQQPQTKEHIMNPNDPYTFETFDLVDILDDPERLANETPLHDDYSEESSP